MGTVQGAPFLEYLQAQSSRIISDSIEHLLLAVQVLAVSALLAVVLSVLTYRSALASNSLLNTTVVAFTVPSVAFFAIMQPLTGLSVLTVFVPLVVYALIPMVRNTLVGLQGVDEKIIDAARGQGMSRTAILLRVELPIAWPVILTGIRVAAILTISLTAIAALVNSNIGLGGFVFDGLDNLGSFNALNSALVGTIFTAVLAVVADLFFVLARRFTTPRGLRV
ncbi:ABC transporter permease [Nocardioidaceae bacterium]|nr:ABC transporter permease [Nocardioidaceae bacterium]